MAIVTIKAWVYNTPEEGQAVIDAIDALKGYPDGTTNTYCEGESNNGKWVILATPEMEVNFSTPPVDFDFVEPEREV